MKVPELRRRILFTLAMIVVVRLGVQIPLPGIDVMELQKVIEASANASGPGAGLATVLTIFSGGGLQQCGIFALGIMPYISASIMTQLLSAVVPQWAKMVREEGGRQKMTKWTRAIAIVIALVQGWFLVGTLEHPERLQAVGLRLVRRQLRQHPRQAYCLVGEVRAHPVVTGSGAVALIEDQVDHGHHVVESLDAVGADRQIEFGAHLRQRLLRSGDPLGHRRFGGQETASDLAGGQSTHHAQGQGSP